MGSPKRIVICGGGAIGAAIAYFVSLRGALPIVIERYEVGEPLPASRAVFWRSTGARVHRWINWRGVASRFMLNFPPTLATLGDIGG
jgi:glycine/D-amino acid oxidase-like deaminating enzyme